MITPAIIPGVSTGAILLFAIVFILILVGTIGYVYWKYRDSGNPWDDFADATAAIVETENADAIAIIPYSDGPILPKPALYDRDLIGGKGGYRTPDGDRIYVDGEGNGKYSLNGVDVILGIDPTEHAAAADPLKAYIAHEKNTGRWIKMDRVGNLLDVGKALTSIDGVTPAMDISKEEAQQAFADGGAYPSEVHRLAAEEGLDLDDALAIMEKQDGLIHKIVDLAPPREAVVDTETGEVHVEEATHVAVDVSSAADMLPKKVNTTELQVAEERARQEGRDHDKIMEYAMIAFVIGGVIGGGIGVVMMLISSFS